MRPAPSTQYERELVMGQIFFASAIDAPFSFLFGVRILIVKDSSSLTTRPKSLLCVSCPPKQNRLLVGSL